MSTDSLTAKNNRLENVKSDIKLHLQKLVDKIDNKIKAFKTPSRANNSNSTKNKETQQRYDELERYGCRFYLMIDSVPK